MTKRAYGQYCGLARAIELVGERWALLIIRDLFVGPRRYSDLHRGLPKIPTNILSTRLKELEQAGIVRRRLLPRPANSVVYELTDYGRELEDIVLPLARWGARSLGEQGREEIVTADSLVVAMRSTFRPRAARADRFGCELRFGDIVLHVSVDRGKLRAEPGPLPGAGLVIHAGPALRELMSGELDPATAVASGRIRLVGDRRLLDRFVDIFQIPPAPAALTA